MKSSKIELTSYYCTVFISKFTGNTWLEESFSEGMGC